MADSPALSSVTGHPYMLKYAIRDRINPPLTLDHKYGIQRHTPTHPAADRKTCVLKRSDRIHCTT